MDESDQYVCWLSVQRSLKRISIYCNVLHVISECNTHKTIKGATHWLLVFPSHSNPWNHFDHQSRLSHWEITMSVGSISVQVHSDSLSGRPRRRRCRANKANEDTIELTDDEPVACKSLQFICVEHNQHRFIVWSMMEFRRKQMKRTRWNHERFTNDESSLLAIFLSSCSCNDRG
jgi:hypothetical protein